MLPPAQAESKTVTHTYKPFSGEFFGRVEETSDEERTTHEGGCHCGAVTFTVTLKWPFPKYTVNSCTCSICTHNGYLLVYPMRQDVKFSGDSEENMGSYKWRHKVADHRFCKTCGSSIMIDLRRPEIFGETDPRKDMVGINVRNFKNIDLDALSYTYFDGKNLI
ncbi:hypothetical protein BCIN_01g09710 [Botrytis cinerea B05.10]|uniref:CENP-V/GFA domain-containing protein n=2 Tax=Botryotinia fuckeliana TaxID=40559 RepID=A0A384J7A2_BOTFB|nr:hypothetical protein BCIN_01g09710 [Botrytis cinerea B05.10]ATZ46360.1 hypothetical protein BCIN_01g09710 [Botrytis cinerea B05.10]EMR81406.1 putative duf636 domain-containing protein [Botrytis cinerea BcDW1]